MIQTDWNDWNCGNAADFFPLLCVILDSGSWYIKRLMLLWVCLLSFSAQDLIIRFDYNRIEIF